MDIELSPETEVEATQVEAPDPVASTPEQSEPKSVRENLIAALQAHKKPTESQETTEKSSRERDPSGKFVKAASPSKDELPEKPAIELPAIKPPESLPPHVKMKWATLSRDVQEAWAQREEEVHKGFTKFDEERVFGKQIKNVVAPYEAMIRAEGGTPDKAIAELLNTAYLLRTASPQQKGQLIWQVARQFGADMSIAQQGAQQVPPFLQQLQQELQQVKGTLAQREALQKQQEQEGLNSQIQAFSADPQHVHFEKVKPVMAALLSAGTAKDLQDAYDKAVYADPEIRSTLLQQQQAEAEAKRVADQKAKAEAARKAAGSIKGAPGLAIAKMANGSTSLRETLKAAYREAHA